MGLDDLRAVRRTVVALGYEQNESEARPFLQHEDSVVRELALGALHRMHSLTNADLELALRDDDRLVRRRAAELGALYPEVDLTPLLVDLEPVVIEMAVWAHGEREEVDDNTLQTIISLTTDHDDQLVREAGAAALGALRSVVRRLLCLLLSACGRVARCRARTARPDVRVPYPIGGGERAGRVCHVRVA